MYKELGDIMTTGERLKNLRLKSKLTLQQAGELIGITKQNLFKYESDVITNIPIDKLEKLAEIYNTTPIEILGWQKYTKITNSNSSSVYDYLPYGVSAGSLDGPDYALQLEKIEISDFIMGPYAKDENILIMHVNGESMNKIIPNGSYIAVKLNYPIYNLENEDIVVVSSNGEYSLKLFFRDGNNVIFRPCSTYHSFTDIKFSEFENFTILGKVVMYCVNL